MQNVGHRSSNAQRTGVSCRRRGITLRLLPLALFALLSAPADRLTAMEFRSGAFEGPRAPVRLSNLAAGPKQVFRGRPGIPADAHRVVLAMALRLKGFDAAEIGRTTAVLQADRLAPPPDLDLSGFGSRGVRFSRYERLSGDANGRSIAGVMDLEDANGRRLSAEFEADYRLARDKLSLERIHWTFAPSESPQLDLFVVPAGALESSLGQDGLEYRELKQVLRSNAINLDAPASWPQGKRDYKIVVVVRDRVALGSNLIMGVSEIRDGRTEMGPDLYRYRFNGWPVAVLPGRFDLSGTGLWVQVKLLEEPPLLAEGDREDRLIGLFALAPH